MASIRLIPNLAEAYSLAQILVSDRESAVDLVGRAFSSASSEGLGRFSVLRAVVRAWGGLYAAGPMLVGTATEADTPPVLDGAVEDVPLVGIQAGRAVRDRLLPSVLGTLDVRDRLMLWFSAVGISTPSDLAVVLGTDPSLAARWLQTAETDLFRRLLLAAALHDRLLVAAAERVEPTRDAVKRLLDTLLEPPPAALARRLAPLTQAGAAPRSRPPRTGRLRRFVLLAGVVVVIGIVGYGIESMRPSDGPEPHRSADAIRTAIDMADGAEPVFRTSSAEQAEIFVRDRLGWSVVAPVIQGSSITGVGFAPALENVDVPVFFYGDGPGFGVTVVVYTYGFLEHAEPDLILDRSIRDQIGEAGHFSLLDVGRRKALVFRNRDDIFVAVTPGDAEALQDAVSFPE